MTHALIALLDKPEISLFISDLDTFFSAKRKKHYAIHDNVDSLTLARFIDVYSESNSHSPTALTIAGTPDIHSIRLNFLQIASQLLYHIKNPQYDIVLNLYKDYDNSIRALYPILNAIQAIQAKPNPDAVKYIIRMLWPILALPEYDGRQEAKDVIESLLFTRVYELLMSAEEAYAQGLKYCFAGVDVSEKTLLEMLDFINKSTDQVRTPDTISVRAFYDLYKELTLDYDPLCNGVSVKLTQNRKTRRILNEVCKKYKVKASEVISPSVRSTRPVGDAKALGCYLMEILTDVPQSDIAQIYGYAQHSTVSRNAERIKYAVSHDEVFRGEVEEIIKRVNEYNIGVLPGYEPKNIMK